MKQTVHIGHRAVARRVAAIYFLGATAWIVGSDLVLLLWMPESAPALAGSIAKGMAFVLVTTIVLYGVLRRIARMESQPVPTADTAGIPGTAGWRALAPFLALGLVLIAMTILISVRDARDQRRIAREQLESSASFKARELQNWLNQRSQSALAYRRARFFQEDLPSIFAGDRAARGRLEKRLEEIRKALKMDAILILDADGRTRVALGGRRGVSGEFARDAAEVTRTRNPRLHVLHRAGTAGDSPLVLDQIVPVEFASPESAATAVVVLRDDVASTLLPMLAFRPFASRSAESYLVRRAGDRIEYLSGLKEKPAAALTLGPRAADTERASAQLLRGAGFAEYAIDYRGTPVLAAAREISGTDWHLISKVDVDEVLAQARIDAAMYITVIVGLTLLAALGTSRLWRQQAQLVELRERALATERDAVGKHLDLLSRHANDMIFLIDPQGRIAEANERAIARYGYPRERLIGMAVADLRPPAERAEGWARRDKLLREGGQVYEVQHMTAAGEVFPVEVSARPVETGGATYIQSINRDLSARKRAEARIERLQRLRDALSATNRAIVRKKSEQGLFEKICEIVVQKAGFRFAWIAVADRERPALQPAANAGTPEEYLAALRQSFENPSIEGFGIIRPALHDARLIVSQDFANDPRMAPWHELGRKWGIGSMAAVPILKHGAPFALLNVYSGDPNTFDDEYLSLLEEMAGDVSYALGVMQRDRELATARERLELAMEGAGFGVWDWWDVTDPAHVWWSKRAGELAGRESEGDAYDAGNFTARIHPDDRPRRQAALDAALRNEAPFDIEYRVRHGDGSYRWLRSKGHRVVDASGKVARMLGVFEDIDLHKRGEVALLESEHRFRALLEQSIAAVYVIQDGKLVYVNPRTREIFGYAPGEPLDPDPMAHIAPQERGRVTEQIMRRLGDQPEAAYSVAALRRDGTAFTLGVHAKQASFDGRPAIIAIAQDITEKARAESEIRRIVEQLKRAVQSTIEVVSTIGELRDPYTHGHERRVGEIATSMATEMGLSADFVEGIRVAGYLHDVGKIGVPAEILSKPARLTKPEFDLVKAHAQQSYEILKGVEFPWPVAEAAWQHHERLDGSGYPRGLKGDEIILEARILAVADTVEAMSSHRPYRPGLGIDAALAEIEKCRGTLYDADAVDACVRLFREKGYRPPA
jgi:PAS domain S-box-containing protein